MAGKSLLPALAALALVSCGGGGGGGGSGSGISTTPSTPPTSPFTGRSSPPTGMEYANSFGLRLANAVTAYTGNHCNGGACTGVGVVLGQIDSGTYWRGSGISVRTHSELQGRLVTGPTDAGARNDRGLVPTPADAEHGVTVAAMMVGNRGNGGIHGMAPSARLRVLTLGLGSAGGTYIPVTLVNSLDSDAALVNHFTSGPGRDVLAVNNSWGYNGIITSYRAIDIRGALPNFIAALEQRGVADANKKIMVWSAGNANGLVPGGALHPEILPGLPYHITELRGHSLAVVSVDSGGVISSFSNRCGVAADFCLAAPGELAFDWRAVPNPDAADNVQSYVSTGAGTSFAAPLVTGALALLKSHPRIGTMGNHELVQRLLMTATKDGRYSDDDIYGQGLLHVDNALTMPVGPISIRLGRSLSDSAAHRLESSALMLSSPLAALRASASAHEIEAYDSINTPFRYPLHSFLSPEDSSDDALQRLLAARTLDARLLRHGEESYAVSYSGMDMHGRKAYGGKFWFSLGDNALWLGSGLGARRHHAEPMFSGVHGFSSPFTGMAEGGFALGMGGSAFANSVWQLEGYVPGTHHSSLDSVDTLGLVASLSSLTGASPWSLSAGMLREGSSVLSSVGSGAFGELDATTWHGGVDVSHHFGAWSAYAAGHFGVTSGGSGSGLWRGVSSLRSSSWALGLVRRGVFSGDDALGVRVVQSLRAEGGSARFLLPKSRDVYGNLYSKEVSLSAEPGGRELDFALGWQRALSSGGSFSMDFGVTAEPGHVASAGPRMWGGLALTHSF